ncbi:hypothetical protein Tco_1187524, partial [Tanacetum coccineum]
MIITRSGMTPEAIEELINQRVAEALAAYEANHAAGLVVESESQNEDDGDDKMAGETETKTVGEKWKRKWRRQWECKSQSELL